MSADFEISPKPFDENHPKLFDKTRPKARLRSLVSAVCSQRFIVQAKLHSDPKNWVPLVTSDPSEYIALPAKPNMWIPLGIYDGGESVELPVWSVKTTYRIIGEHYYNATWRNSSAELWSYINGTLLAIYFEDDTPGDRDYNDLIIQIDFANNFKGDNELVPVERPKHPPPPQPLPPGGGKPYPIKPTHPH
jgi:hypothetical protein